MNNTQFELNNVAALLVFCLKTLSKLKSKVIVPYEVYVYRNVVVQHTMWFPNSHTHTNAVKRHLAGATTTPQPTDTLVKFNLVQQFLICYFGIQTKP